MCKSHNIEYQYICPRCVEPYLKGTEFPNLAEIREYQKENSKKVDLLDTVVNFDLIGIIKVKLIEKLAYSGILIYDLKEKRIVDTHFKSYKPLFTKYFPSILFLNHTGIYLDLLRDLEIKPDCYIINSSGQIHPFYYGAACDFGLKVKVPVIGYTNKLLFGALRTSKKNSNIFEVFHEERLLGFAIPKPNSKKFFYISVGNNISLDTAKKLFLKLDLKLLSDIKVKLNNFIHLNVKTKN